MHQEESYHQAIRDISLELEKSEYRLAQAEAELKKLIAIKKIEAAAQGVKTAAAQDTWADSLDEVFQARLAVGVASGQRSAARARLKAAEVEFEQWKANLYLNNREARRYGA